MKPTPESRALQLPEWSAELRYRVSGTAGHPVVYLPALGCPVDENFAGVVHHPGLPPHRGWCIDFLGAGTSDRPATFPYTLEAHAETVAAVLDREGVTAGIVVGHSMGGTVGILLALQRPDLVSRLVVGEANLTPGGGAGSRHIASFEEAEFVESIFSREQTERLARAAAGDRTADRLAQLWADADPLALHRNAAALVNLDPTLEPRFLDLPVPRTFVYGERTLPCSAEAVGPDTPDPATLRHHGVDVAVVPHAGHWLMLENAEGFVEVLHPCLVSGSS